MMLKNAGRYDEAIRELLALLQQAPDDAHLHTVLAMTYHLCDRLTDARGEYDISIRLDPNNPVAHNNLASLFQDLDQTSDAEHEYRVAIRLDPNYVLARENLARLLYETNDEKAEYEYNEILRIQQDNVNACIHLARILLGKRRYVEAAEMIVKVGECDPGNEELAEMAKSIKELSDEISGSAEDNGGVGDDLPAADKARVDDNHTEP